VCDLLRGEEVTDETLALGTVEEVGPGGHYLGASHTRANMRRAVVRGLAHQPSEAGLGYRDPVVVAHQRTDEILAEYEPRRLPEDLRDELARIVAAVDSEIAG
jgi:trimethylamine--corrinoid protein Co-methyltransferase